MFDVGQMWFTGQSGLALVEITSLSFEVRYTMYQPRGRVYLGGCTSRQIEDWVDYDHAVLLPRHKGEMLLSLWGCIK